MATERISRKNMENMGFGEFLRRGREPYMKLLAYLKPYRFRFGMGIVFGALFGAVNGAMIFALQYTFAVILPSDPSAQQGGGHLSGLGHMAGALNKGGDGIAPFWEVMIACMIIPTLIAIRGLFSYLNAYCMMWVGNRVLDDIRRDLFSRLMRQSLDFYGKAKAGDLIQTVFNQTRMAQTALTTVCSDLVKQPISILTLVIALFMMDWKFTMLALVVFPLCVVPVILIGKKVRASGSREEEQAGALMTIMHESFTGIRVVKSYAREDYEQKRFNGASSSMLRMMMRWQKAMELIGPVVETVASIGIAAGLVYAWANRIPAEKFLTLYLGLVALYPSAKSLSRIQLLLQKCLAATSKVFEMMERAPAIQDKPDAVVLKGVRGDVEFEDVTFTYGGKGPPAVRKISLSIAAGQSVALVGRSGAGKTTMFSLLLRFYDPVEGRILVDGTDIRDATQESLRDHLGIVTQDTFLFHDTIRENIRYGRLAATDEEVQAAAEQAYAHEFVMEQPQGYDTVVGDKGCLLSGGQQQRLSIARAILRNAPILLLDEAMSALDSESEKKVQAAIEHLAAGKTVMAIAHRLSTILNSDMIVVMESGRLVATGTHAELLESSPHYRKLYNMQFGHVSGVGGTDAEMASSALADLVPARAEEVTE